jgi:hypothetical protein
MTDKEKLEIFSILEDNEGLIVMKTASLEPFKVIEKIMSKYKEEGEFGPIAIGNMVIRSSNSFFFTPLCLDKDQEIVSRWDNIMDKQDIQENAAARLIPKEFL